MTWLTKLSDHLVALHDRRPPDFIIGDAADPYLRRWWLIPRNRFFNVYLHEFLRSDDDRALHDHPWWNLSVLLRGNYIEVTPRRRQVPGAPTVVYRFREAGGVKFRFAGARHRILLNNERCWTLFITGPRIRDWGFWCPQGFVPWQKFTAGENGEVVGKGCDQ